MDGLDGIVLPGGESTAMGLIGTSTTKNTNKATTMWDALKEFSSTKPTWGTCAGMILLAQQCVGASAVIENGQSLIGGVDILVCRNYFGSQVSSFEMPTEAPPGIPNNNNGNGSSTESSSSSSFPGIFIRAPAILSAGPDVTVLGKVVAAPCKQASVVLKELEQKIQNGEQVEQMSIIEIPAVVVTDDGKSTDAREVISAVRKNQLLCTAFHPELSDDHRWHEYFANMVKDATMKK